MKPLRNILLLFAYIIAIISIVLSFVLKLELIWIPLFALLLVGIAYGIVKSERRHSRGPAIVSIIALILTYCVPYFFPVSVENEEEFSAEVEEKSQEHIENIEKMVEEGIVDLGEETNDSNEENTEQDPSEEFSSEPTEIIEVTDENVEEVSVEERGLAVPELVD